jgi:rhodanese-related sulfurtransferase
MFTFLKSLFAKNYDDLRGEAFKRQFSSTSGAVLLDVRTPSEFASGKIRGALNVDVMSATFGTRIAALDKQKTYFVYCRSGSRSAQACKYMAAQGYKVYNLAGGMSAWPK